jgi:phenylpyruvate tautomerase PptA (4-oxalocrotonate tautomerase family)
MPLVKIHICDGKAKEHRKAVLSGVHEALVSSLS